MVSSTVPRLEDKCPPVLLTDSTRNPRNSLASCGNCSRSKWRRSSGVLMVLSNEYINGIPDLLAKELYPKGRSGSARHGGQHPQGVRRGCKGLKPQQHTRSPPYKNAELRECSSKLSQHDEISQFAKALCGITEFRQCFHCLAMQTLRHVARTLYTQQADVSRLVVIRILARRFAQRGGILSLIHISEPTRLGMISYAVFCLT